MRVSGGLGKRGGEVEVAIVKVEVEVDLRWKRSKYVVGKRGSAGGWLGGEERECVGGGGGG